MAIREIITLGFGPQSPVHFIPTLGFGLSNLAPPNVPGIEYRWGGDRMHYRYEKYKRLHYRWGGDRMHYRLNEE